MSRRFVYRQNHCGTENKNSINRNRLELSRRRTGRMADSFKNSRKTARLKRVVVTFVRKLEFDNQKTRARVLIFVRPLLPTPLPTFTFLRTLLVNLLRSVNMSATTKSSVRSTNVTFTYIAARFSSTHPLVHPLKDVDGNNNNNTITRLTIRRNYTRVFRSS